MVIKHLKLFTAFAITVCIMLAAAACGDSGANGEPDLKAPDSTKVEQSDAQDENSPEEKPSDDFDEDYPEITSFFGTFSPDVQTVRSLMKEHLKPDYKYTDISVTSITDEQIDELLAHSYLMEVQKLFKTERSITVGDNTYSPLWLANHSVEDYKQAGIAPKAHKDLLDYYADFKDSSEAIAHFTDNLDNLMVMYGSDIVYKDRTLPAFGGFPTVMKDFVIIGDQMGEDGYYLLYLADNCPTDGDDNIYTALFMCDQLINVDCDSSNSYVPYLMFLYRVGAYLPWEMEDDEVWTNTALDAPLVGTVVRLAWSGIAKTSEGNSPYCLTWMSRIQFSDTKCAYTQDELDVFVKRLAECEKDFDRMLEYCDYRPNLDDIYNGYELVTGIEPYKLLSGFSGKMPALDDVVGYTEDQLKFMITRYSREKLTNAGASLTALIMMPARKHIF